MDILSQNMKGILKEILDEQITHEKNGDYVKAEECRKKFQQEKKNQQNKSHYEMQAKHRKQQDQLRNQHNKEITDFNTFWDNKLNEFQKQCERLQNELSDRHKKQYEETRQHLEDTLPKKLKESSELLNLRKMQEHMAKQKNYPEAHKIQKKIEKMMNGETNQWNTNRQNKLSTALETLKAKQNVEMENLKKRNKTHLDEQLKDRKITEDTINHKYENLMIDLKVVQEKEILSFKGELKSAVGSPTKKGEKNGKK